MKIDVKTRGERTRRIRQAPGHPTTYVECWTQKFWPDQFSVIWRSLTCISYQRWQRRSATATRPMNLGAFHNVPRQPWKQMKHSFDSPPKRTSGMERQLCPKLGLMMVTSVHVPFMSMQVAERPLMLTLALDKSMVRQ